jgi:hypothetical protein
MKNTKTNNMPRSPAPTRQNSTINKLIVDPKLKNKAIENKAIDNGENKKEPKKTNRDTVLGKLCSCCGSKNKGNTPYPDGEAGPDDTIPEHKSMNENPSQLNDPRVTESGGGGGVVNITIHNGPTPVIKITRTPEEEILNSFLDPVRNVRISLNDIPKLLSRIKL